MKRPSRTFLGVAIAAVIVILGLFVTVSDLRRLSWSNAGAPDLLDVRDTSQVAGSSRDSALVLRDTSRPKPIEIDTLKRRSGLIIPVAGVKPEHLVDTYTAARSQGRTHNAIDIVAGKSTPVLAAADGTVRRLFYSEKGGITIYQLSSDSLTVYYYAHLERYATGLTEGKPLKQGEVIGYVGDTGNSGAGNYHLHFAVWKIKDPKDFWTGEDQNPYILLRY